MPLGRTILEWYWNLEDFAALVLYRPLILPEVWRDEALRIRRELVAKEYPSLTPEARFPRWLDDMSRETRAAIPAFNKIIVTIASLNHLYGKQLDNAVESLEKNITFVWDSITKIKESPQSSQLFETIEVGLDEYSPKHAGCCPTPPFHSLLKYVYPPAAYLDLMILAMRGFIRCHLYIPAQRVGCHVEMLEQEFRRVQMEHVAYEMCRMFAAIEEALDDHPGALMPCFNAFIMAGFNCDVGLRPWLWHKLAHFEELGSTFIEPNKRQLAILWGMPELPTRGFTSFKIEPLENRMEDCLDSEVIDEAGKAASEESPGRPEVVDQESLDLDEMP